MSKHTQGVLMEDTNKRMRRYLKQYRKTKKGHIFLRYWGMKRRIKGTAGKRSSSFGLDLCPQEEFIGWANSPEFNKLWYAWVDSGFSRALTPVVDRIETSKGYSLGNLQWLTLGQNSIKGVTVDSVKKESRSGFIGVAKRHHRFTAHVSQKGKSIYVGIFKTAEEAARARDKWARMYQGKFARLNFPD